MFPHTTIYRCAILFKKSRFNLVEKHALEFNHVAMSRARGMLGASLMCVCVCVCVCVSVCVCVCLCVLQGGASKTGPATRHWRMLAYADVC